MRASLSGLLREDNTTGSAPQASHASQASQPSRPRRSAGVVPYHAVVRVETG